MVIYIVADLDAEVSYDLKVYDASMEEPILIEMTRKQETIWFVDTELSLTKHFCEVIDDEDNVWGSGWIDSRDNPISLKMEPPDLDVRVEGGYSQAQLIRLHTSILAGLLSGVDPFEGVNTLAFKALNGVTTRLSANTDNVGNRSVVTILNLD